MVSKKSQGSRIIIFAGAGASAGLTMPTTPQFVKSLGAEWPKLNMLLGEYKKYRVYIEEPKKPGETIDAEELRDWFVHMRQMAEHAEYLLHNQPFETKVSDSSYSSQFIKAILDEFDSIIRKTYGSVVPELAYQHYEQLFSIMAEYKINLVPFFTTNYDLVLESLDEYEEFAWPIETGMEKKGTRVVLNTKRFDKVSNELPALLLFKLHGSTDWWRNTNTGKVEQVAFGISPPTHYKELLIYPTREKFNQVSEEPFSFFYDKLESYLSSRKLRLCIVIGYSFRDKLINERFGRAIKRGLRMLIFDPNMSKEQFKHIFPKAKVDTQVQIENISFGDWSEPKKIRLKEILSQELNAVS